MARDLGDLALFADAMAGSSPLAGLGKPHDPGGFRDAVANPCRPSRIAFSTDLGVTETSPEIAAICSAAVTRLEHENIAIESAHPDLGLAHRAFDVARALDYALSYGPDLERIRSDIKPENIWNIEFGLGMSSDDVLEMMAAQARLFQNASRFMLDYDLLICPAAIVAPFPVEERYPGFGAGLAYSEYYRWLAIVYAITVTTLPVITIPCGKTDDGLPVGLQLIGKAHGERELFAFARYLERIFDWNPLQRIET